MEPTSKKALVVVDIQDDWIPGGKLPVSDWDDSVITTINELMDQFDIVVATKDWHPDNHGSFASAHDKKPGEVIDLDGVEQILWPDHCIQGSIGAEFPPGFRDDLVDKTFLKGIDVMTDSYSAIFDNARRRKTGLDDYLKEQGVSHVYITGLATDYCIKYTVLDALDIGFEVTVVLDGCRPVALQPEDEQKAINEMEAAGAHICRASEVLATCND